MPDLLSGFVTVTSILPGARAAVEALICVALTSVTFVAAAPPSVTVPAKDEPGVPAKFEPLIVTLVPPYCDPLTGETELTVGAAK